MNEFYRSYYRAVRTSRAHADFCERAYGADLCQHGFMTMRQLKHLLYVARLGSESRVLDVGCGNGMIAEYIAGQTGAHMTGIDNCLEAIAHARARTGHGAVRLRFAVGDLMLLPLRPQSFDAIIAIDSLYFSDDYAATLRGWQSVLATGGQMWIFFSHGADPQHPEDTFDRATLPPDRTPLGEALRQLALPFDSYDFTADDLALAQRKVEALTVRRAEFESEGNLFLYEQRLGEARGVLHAAEIRMHARYLYRVRGQTRAALAYGSETRWSWT